MKRLLFLLALAMLFAGCRTTRETVEVPVYIHDTNSIVQQVHDSTYIDRWHTEYVKGDSVYVHDSIDRWHSIVKHDTLNRYVEVPVEREITRYVEKPLNGFQRLQKNGFWVLMAGILAYGSYRTRKWWLPWIKNTR